jgi:predicted esterase
VNAVFVALAALALTACGGPGPRREVATPVAAQEAPAAAGAPEPAPAAEVVPEPSRAARPPSGLLRLPVPGFDDATVSFAPRAPLPLPLMVVAHGAGNTPDGMCDTFRAVVGDRAVLLCPAGPRVARGEEGRYYPDHFALEKIVLASVDALVAKYPAAVDAANAVYSGYSQGATMGALMISGHGDRFPRLLLVEGGVEGWTLSRAKQFQAAGGRRALFACGTPHCEKHARAVSDILQKAGVEATVVADVHAGHTYGGTVAEAVHGAFDALVAGDPRFAAR